MLLKQFLELTHDDRLCDFILFRGCQFKSDVDTLICYSFVVNALRDYIHMAYTWRTQSWRTQHNTFVLAALATLITVL